MSQTFITQAVRNLSIANKLSLSEKEWSIFLMGYPSNYGNAVRQG